MDRLPTMDKSFFELFLLGSLIAVAATPLLLRLAGLRWHFRVPLAIAIGWAIIFFSTQLHWEMMSDAAITQEEKMYVASKDTGKATMAFFIGWIYAAPITLAVEVLMLIVVTTKLLVYKNHSNVQ